MNGRVSKEIKKMSTYKDKDGKIRIDKALNRRMKKNYYLNKRGEL